MIIDTHIHLHDSAFDEDREELLCAFRKAGVAAVVDIAAERDSLSKVVSMTQTYEPVYGALGLHPDEVGDLDEDAEAYIEAHLSDPKIVAVGEIGLDYHWMVQPKEVQAAAFERQIGIACRAKLPVMIHSRDAAEDTLAVVRNAAGQLRAALNGRGEDEPIPHRNGSSAGETWARPLGIMHCYSYSAEHARLYAEMGFLLGIGGVVTFSNAKKLKQVVREIPLTHLVLETDAPYLAPTPHRGERNSSAYLPLVVSAIAELKGISVSEVEDVTTENAKRLLGGAVSLLQAEKTCILGNEDSAIR